MNSWKAVHERKAAGDFAALESMENEGTLHAFPAAHTETRGAPSSRSRIVSPLYGSLTAFGFYKKIIMRRIRGKRKSRLAMEPGRKIRFPFLAPETLGVVIFQNYAVSLAPAQGVVFGADKNPALPCPGEGLPVEIPLQLRAVVRQPEGASPRP